MRTLAVLTALCAIMVVTTAAQRVGQTETRQAVTQIVHFRQSCRSAEKAIVFYRGNTWKYQHALGEKPLSTYYPERRKNACAYKRFVASSWRGLASAYRKAYDKWIYEYAWWIWMPDKHQRVGACETGYGKRPGNFSWDSGTYVSFAGIYRAGYDDDAHRVGNLGWDETKRKLGRLPTPREQMEAVDSHRARWGGWSGWGCRGA